MTLATSLQRLEESQMLRRLPAQGDDLGESYVFKHALTQDAAYRSLTRRQRCKIHRRVAELTEELFADELNKHASDLARHYAAAGDDPKAFHYSVQAGDAAFRLFASSEASVQYDRAVVILEREGVSREQVDHGTLTRLFLQRGRALELAYRHQDAVANYRTLQALGKRWSDPRLELAGLTELAVATITPSPAHDSAAGAGYARQALALAEQLGARAVQARVLWAMLLHGWAAGWQPEMIGYGEQSLAIARELGLREQMGTTLSDLAFAYGAFGRVSEALESAEQASHIWRELGNLPMLANALNVAAVNYLITGRLDRLEAVSLEAARISEPIGNLWSQLSGLMMAGVVEGLRGRYQAAIGLQSEAVALARQGRLASQEVLSRGLLAWSCAAAGQRGAAQEHAAQAELLAAGAPPVIRAWALALVAEVCAGSRQLERAGAALAEAGRDLRGDDFSVPAPAAILVARIALAQAAGDLRAVLRESETLLNLRARLAVSLGPYAVQALLARGLALVDLGRVEEARRALQQARDEAGDMAHYRQQIEAALASLDASTAVA